MAFHHRFLLAEKAFEAFPEIREGTGRIWVEDGAEEVFGELGDAMQNNEEPLLLGDVGEDGLDHDIVGVFVGEGIVGADVVVVDFGDRGEHHGAFAHFGMVDVDIERVDL